MRKCIICGQLTNNEVCPKCGGDTLEVEEQEDWGSEEELWDERPQQRQQRRRPQSQQRRPVQGRQSQYYDEDDYYDQQGYDDYDRPMQDPYNNQGMRGNPYSDYPDDDYGRPPYGGYQGQGYGRGQYRQGYDDRPPRQGQGYGGRPPRPGQGYDGRLPRQGQGYDDRQPRQGYNQGQYNQNYRGQGGYQDPYGDEPPYDEENSDTGFLGDDPDDSGFNRNTKIAIGVGCIAMVALAAVSLFFVFHGSPTKRVAPTPTQAVERVTPTPTLTPKQVAAQQKKKEEALAKKKKEAAARKKKKAEEKAAKLKEKQRVEYILPDSDTIKLTSEQVKELSNDDLNIAKNEMYARHGRIFEDGFLSSYFQGTTWNKPTTPASEFSDSVFNSVEVYNLQILTKEENRRANKKKKKQEAAQKKKEQEAAEAALKQQQEEARRQQQQQAQQQLDTSGEITTSGTRVYSTAIGANTFSFVYPDSWVENVQIDTQTSGNQLDIICRNRVCLNAYGDQYGAEVFRLILTTDGNYGNNVLSTQDVNWISNGQLGDYYLYEYIPNVADIPEDDTIIAIQGEIRNEIPNILTTCTIK